MLLHSVQGEVEGFVIVYLSSQLFLVCLCTSFQKYWTEALVIFIQDREVSVSQTSYTCSCWYLVSFWFMGDRDKRLLSVLHVCYQLLSLWLF